VAYFVLFGRKYAPTAALSLRELSLAVVGSTVWLLSTAASHRAYDPEDGSARACKTLSLWGTFALGSTVWVAATAYRQSTILSIFNTPADYQTHLETHRAGQRALLTKLITPQLVLCVTTEIADALADDPLVFCGPTFGFNVALVGTLAAQLCLLAAQSYAMNWGGCIPEFFASRPKSKGVTLWLFVVVLVTGLAPVNASARAAFDVDFHLVALALALLTHFLSTVLPLLQLSATRNLAYATRFRKWCASEAAPSVNFDNVMKTHVWRAMFYSWLDNYAAPVRIPATFAPDQPHVISDEHEEPEEHEESACGDGEALMSMALSGQIATVCAESDTTTAMELSLCVVPRDLVLLLRALDTLETANTSSVHHTRALQIMKHPIVSRSPLVFDLTSHHTAPAVALRAILERLALRYFYADFIRRVYKHLHSHFADNKNRVALLREANLVPREVLLADPEEDVVAIELEEK